MSLCKTNTISESTNSTTTTTTSSSSLRYKGNWGWQDRGSKVCSKKWDNEFKRAGEALGIDWVLIAALSQQESGWIEDKKNDHSSAGGLYGFLAAYWPKIKNYEDPKWRFNGEIATTAFIQEMKGKMKKFSNAISSNDQILLCIQSWHDGNIEGTSWEAVINGGGNKYTKKSEGQSYVRLIMGRYERLGGSIE